MSTQLGLSKAPKISVHCKYFLGCVNNKSGWCSTTGHIDPDGKCGNKSYPSDYERRGLSHLLVDGKTWKRYETEDQSIGDSTQ